MTLVNLLNTFSIALSVPTGNENFQMEEKNKIEEVVQDSFEEQNSLDFLTLNENEIDLQEPLKNVGNGDGADGDSVSKAISSSSFKGWLDKNYPDFSTSCGGKWTLNYSESGKTADVTNAIPLNVNEIGSGLPFNQEEIKKAIKKANVENKTSYGGCGPIALMGILDYFARYIGFDIYNPNDSSSRIDVATKIFNNTDFSILGNKDNTFIWPEDVVDAFNDTVEELNCDYLRAESEFRYLFPGYKEEFLENIKKSIKNGIPVTLATGFRCGDGDFAEHYANVYGYETWNGISKDGQTKTKTFLKARLNLNSKKNDEYYCDADILDCAQVGIITYSFDKTYLLKANDFSSFVNSSGQGQYFFGPTAKSQDIKLSNGILIKTERIRTSFIESQYLVLSPNRENAGTATLVMSFPHYINRLSFSASMWGKTEGSFYESLCFDYGINGDMGVFVRPLIIQCTTLSTSKYAPDYFTIDFPTKVKSIRFFACHSAPSGDRNKGRICLDNIEINFKFSL